MLGAAGALCCLSAGTALGSWLRDRRLARWRMICAEIDALGGMRLLLEQERPAVPELLTACAGYVSCAEGAEQVAFRFRLAAKKMAEEPFVSVAEAYAFACTQVAAPWERQEERTVMDRFFRQLGSGTAAMRAEAAAACSRRLRPLAEEACAQAQQGGKLCMQLGLLLGLMAGIALW